MTERTTKAIDLKVKFVSGHRKASYGVLQRERGKKSCELTKSHLPVGRKSSLQQSHSWFQMISTIITFSNNKRCKTDTKYKILFGKCG